MRVAKLTVYLLKLAEFRISQYCFSMFFCFKCLLCSFEGASALTGLLMPLYNLTTKLFQGGAKQLQEGAKDGS